MILIMQTISFILKMKHLILDMLPSGYVLSSICYAFRPACHITWNTYRHLSIYCYSVSFLLFQRGFDYFMRNICHSFAAQRGPHISFIYKQLPLLVHTILCSPSGPDQTSRRRSTLQRFVLGNFLKFKRKMRNKADVILNNPKFQSRTFF